MLLLGDELGAVTQHSNTSKCVPRRHFLVVLSTCIFNIPDLTLSTQVNTVHQLTLYGAQRLATWQQHEYSFWAAWQQIKNFNFTNFNDFKLTNYHGFNFLSDYNVSKQSTYKTGLRWCRHQRPYCRTTCVQQSCDSESACRSCLSRLSTLSPVFPPPPGSSPDSFCSPFVWLSELGIPRPQYQSINQSIS